MYRQCLPSCTHIHPSDSAFSHVHTSYTQVVGVTCASTRQDTLHGQKFGFLILDECSQCIEPLSFLPIARFACRVLIGAGECAKKKSKVNHFLAAFPQIPWNPCWITADSHRESLRGCENAWDMTHSYVGHDSFIRGT